MIKTIFIAFAFQFLGLVFYFALKARNYFINGSFTFKIWKQQNLQRFIYASILNLLFSLLLVLAPDAIDPLGEILGFSIELEEGVPKDASLVLIGSLIGTIVFGIDKTKMNEKG